MQFGGAKRKLGGSRGSGAMMPGLGAQMSGSPRAEPVAR
jgi:hypothetical protein